MPPPMSTGACVGPGSSSQAQRSIAATAIAPQRKAGKTDLIVRSRKNAAVNTAATNGAQPMGGICSRYCGRPLPALVTSASRLPVGAPGR
jgi:hypothetical protein